MRSEKFFFCFSASSNSDVIDLKGFFIAVLNSKMLAIVGSNSSFYENVKLSKLLKSKLGAC